MTHVTPENLKHLRRLANMTQTAAADLIGLSHGSVSMFERTGQGVSKAKIKRLLAHLGSIAEERRQAAIAQRQAGR